MSNNSSKKKSSEEKNKKPKTERFSDKKKEKIVIEGKKDDVLASDLVSDPNDFEKEVVREAKRGRATRIILPVVFFVFVASLVGFATWYYQDQSGREEEVGFEEKIQTPPVVDSDSRDHDNQEEPEEEKDSSPDPDVSAPEKDRDGYTEYTVKEGDTLSGIANANGMSSTELAKYNNMSAEDVIRIGDKIKIPDK